MSNKLKLIDFFIIKKIFIHIKFNNFLITIYIYIYIYIYISPYKIYGTLLEKNWL